MVRKPNLFEKKKSVLQRDIRDYESEVGRLGKETSLYESKLKDFAKQKIELNKRIVRAKHGFVPTYQRKAKQVQSNYNQLLKTQKQLEKKANQLEQKRKQLTKQTSQLQHLGFSKYRDAVNLQAHKAGLGNLIGKYKTPEALAKQLSYTVVGPQGEMYSADSNLFKQDNTGYVIGKDGTLAGVTGGKPEDINLVRTIIRRNLKRDHGFTDAEITKAFNEAKGDRIKLTKDGKIVSLDYNDIIGQSRLPTPQELIEYNTKRVISSNRNKLITDEIKNKLERQIKLSARSLGIYDDVKENYDKFSKSQFKKDINQANKLVGWTVDVPFKMIENLPESFGASPEQIKKSSEFIYSRVGVSPIGYDPLGIKSQNMNLQQLRQVDPYITKQIFPDNILGTTRTGVQLYLFGRGYTKIPTFAQLAFDAHMIDAGYNIYKNEDLPKATRYVGAFQGGIGALMAGSKINLGKVPFLRERQIIVADSGELVPLASRRSVLDAISNNKYAITLTSRKNIFNNRYTNVPRSPLKGSSHAVNPEGITWDYTYNIPIRFATFEQSGGILPTSKIFSQKWIGKASINKVKIQKFDKKFLDNVKNDILTKGKTSEANIKKIYKDALAQAESTGEPVATFSPKLLRGFEQAELELVNIFPKNYKPKVPKFIGFTPEGSPVFSTLPWKEIFKNKLSSELRFNKKISDYWEDIGRRKLDYLRDSSNDVPNAYAQHGKAHLIDNQPWGKNDYMHDLVKIMDTDSFSQYPHGPTQAKLIKQGRYDDILSHLSKTEKIKFAEGVGGHEYWRPNLKTMFMKPNGGITIPSLKQIRYSLPEWIIKNNHLQRISTLDRLDLIRLGIKPNLEFMSKSVLRDLGLIKPKQKLNFENLFNNLPSNIKNSYNKFSKLRKTNSKKVKEMEVNHLNYLSQKYSPRSLATYGKMYYNIDKIPNLNSQQNEALKNQADEMIKKANINARLKSVIDFENWSPIPKELGKNLSNAETRFLRNLFEQEYKPKGITKFEFMEHMAEKGLLKPLVRDRILKLKAEHKKFFENYIKNNKKSIKNYKELSKSYRNNYRSKYRYSKQRDYSYYIKKSQYGNYGVYDSKYTPKITQKPYSYSNYTSEYVGYPQYTSPLEYSPYMYEEINRPMGQKVVVLPKGSVQTPKSDGKVKTPYYGDPFYRITGTPRYSKQMNIDLRKIYRTGFG